MLSSQGEPAVVPFGLERRVERGWRRDRGRGEGAEAEPEPFFAGEVDFAVRPGADGRKGGGVAERDDTPEPAAEGHTVVAGRLGGDSGVHRAGVAVLVAH